MVDVEKCGVGEKEEMGDKQTEMKTNQFINQTTLLHNTSFVSLFPFFVKQTITHFTTFSASNVIDR